MSGRRKLILGIDPGTTCGIAALDLNGRLLSLESRRGFTRSEIVDIALSLGEPVVVASDVSPPSGYVKKFASALSAVLYVPDQPMTAEEKVSLAKSFAESFGVDLGNSHERDALAAALKAYLHFKNKLRQVEVKVHGLKIPLDEVKALVIRGNTVQNSILRVLSSTQRVEPQSGRAEREVSKGSPDREQLISRLGERTRRQKAEISRLRRRNRALTRLLSEARLRADRLEKEVGRLKREEISELRRERRYRLLQEEVSSLRRVLHSLREELNSCRSRLASLQDVRVREVLGEAVLLKPIENFTATGIERACGLYRIGSGDRVLLKDASGGGSSTARRLAELGVSVVVAGSPMAHQATAVFKALNIPVIPSEELSISWVEGYPYTSSDALEEKIEELRALEKKSAREEVESVIAGYREERKGGGGAKTALPSRSE